MDMKIEERTIASRVLKPDLARLETHTPVGKLWESQSRASRAKNVLEYCIYSLEYKVTGKSNTTVIGGAY